MHIAISYALPSDAATIAQFAIELTDEISRRMDARQFDLNVGETAALCAELLASGKYIALLASVDGRHAGFLAMSEGHSLYANGAIGTVQEMYVAPGFRSQAIGAALMDAAKACARERGWRRLEVCTPPLPEFDASLQFYASNGFEVSGGRKMKVLTS